MLSPWVTPIQWNSGWAISGAASPAKFPDTIRAAIGLEPVHPSLEALKSRPLVKHRIKATTEAIRTFIEARAV
mgnify:CR=1 FL=1